MGFLVPGVNRYCEDALVAVAADNCGADGEDVGVGAVNDGFEEVGCEVLLRVVVGLAVGQVDGRGVLEEVGLLDEVQRDVVGGAAEGSEE